MRKKTPGGVISKPNVRAGTPSAQLSREEFAKRARERFYDPAFSAVTSEIDRIIEMAGKNYSEYHKSPRTLRAGAGFSDPDFSLPIEWLEMKAIGNATSLQLIRSWT